MPEASANGIDERSLLEDASTLLLFSKTRSGSGSNNDTGSNKSPMSSPRDNSSQRSRQQSTVQSPPLSTTPTGSEAISPRNTLGSVGPASVALMRNESIERSRSESVSSITSNGNMKSDGSNIANNNNGNNKKGMVAAAALAAAATVPLPLKTELRRKNSVDIHVNDSASTGVQRKRREWPIPDSYIVDIDSGIISCICGFNDDDGFTIQCDHCNRWQHAICYNIKDIETAPEDHLCNTCEPRKLDVKRARRKQLEKFQQQAQQVNKLSVSPPTGSKGDADSSDESRKNNNNRANIGTDNHDNVISNGKRNGISKKPHTSFDNGEGLHENLEEEKKRKNVDDVAIGNGLKRKRDNASYFSAKDAYTAMYLPMDTYEFKDKYVKLFIDKHADDDWVIPYGKEVFQPLPVEVKPYSEVNNVKVFPGFTKLGLYLMEDCDRKGFICEYIGEVDFQKNYLMDPRNHYRIWGTTKPRVLFHPHWPLHIDARLCGNITRYMRRSCNPNVELVTIRMSDTNEVKFVLRATRKIEKGDEIHIDWQWDLRHPIWQIINGTATFDSLNDPDKYLLIHSIDTVLGACDCACGNNNKDCNLLKVKKFSQSLYRTVKSKMNNRYKLNEILNQYQGKRRRPPPILTRLTKEASDNEERAPKILTEFNDQKLRYLTSQADEKDSNGDRVIFAEGSASDSIKPYKWLLLEKQKKRSETHEGGLRDCSGDSTVITNPADYNELNVEDLAKLPVPIVLEVPLHQNHGVNDIKVDHQGSHSTMRQDLSSKGGSSEALIGVVAAADKAAPTGSQSPVLGRSAKVEEKSNSSSAASLPDLTDASRKSLKKKLSFADYRKKQSK